MSLTITKKDRDGSEKERLVFCFNCLLEKRQQNIFELKLLEEFEDYIYIIRWRGSSIAVVHVRKRTLRDCSRLDIENAVDRIAAAIH